MARKVVKKVESKWEVKALELLIGIKAKPEREHRFHPIRRWRFDFAYPKEKIAIEIEGGTWIRGRHIHPLGFQADCEKYNAAAKLGWKVYRLTPPMITADYLSIIFS